MRIRLLLPAIGLGTLLGAWAPIRPSHPESSWTYRNPSSHPGGGNGLEDPESTRSEQAETRILRAISYAEGLLRIEKADAALAVAERLPMDGPHGRAAMTVRAWALLAGRGYAELSALLVDHDGIDGELLFLRGAARWRGRDREGGLSDLRHLWWASPRGVWALYALGEMANPATADPGPYTAAEQDLVHRVIPSPHLDGARLKPDRVDRAWTTLLAKAPGRGLLAAEIHHGSGVRLLAAEEFTAAVAEFRQALRQTAEPHLQRVIQLHLGEAERRRGNFSAARKHFARVAAGAEDAFAHEALTSAGQMAIEFRHYGEARRLFEQQLLQNPIGKARHEALWGLGWVAFRTGDFASARRFCQTLVSESPYGPLAPRGLYWGARALEEMGFHGSTGAEMAALELRFPVDYYAYRARQWRSQHDSVSALSLAVPLSPPPSDQRVAHIVALADAGMYHRARVALQSIRSNLEALSPDQLQTLEDAARTVSNRSLATRFRRARHKRFPMDEASLSYLASRFPPRYVKLLNKQAHRQRIDPAIPSAVASCESGFRPDAVSPVGALGLMQLMPETARLLFKEEQLKHAPAESEILDPKNNTRLGVRYLGRLLRAFNHRIEYAVSAYNAGPGAVTRWRQARGDLPTDIFVEEIPYAETRHYTRRVITMLQVQYFLQTQREKEPPPDVPMLAEAGAPAPPNRR